MFVRATLYTRTFSSRIQLKKSLGQHFLKNEGILQKIVQNANICENDVILEIGPGSGLLTQKLLQKPVKVIAVEKDSSLIPVLSTTFQSFIKTNQLSIIEGDILNLPLPDYSRCIANIPYYISSSLLQRIVLENRVFVDYYLLVQKEFCSKLCIDTKCNNHDSTFLTVFLQSYFSISSMFDVPPSCFSPPPKVVSTLMRLSPMTLSSSRPHVQYRKEYMDFLKSLFSTKNKSLRQALQRMQLPQQTRLPLNQKVYQLSTEDCCTLFAELFPLLFFVC